RPGQGRDQPLRRGRGGIDESDERVLEERGGLGGDGGGGQHRRLGEADHGGQAHGEAETEVAQQPQGGAQAGARGAGFCDLVGGEVADDQGPYQVGLHGARARQPGGGGHQHQRGQKSHRQRGAGGGGGWPPGRGVAGGDEGTEHGGGHQVGHEDDA